MFTVFPLGKGSSVSVVIASLTFGFSQHLLVKAIFLWAKIFTGTIHKMYLLLLRFPNLFILGIVIKIFLLLCKYFPLILLDC